MRKNNETPATTSWGKNPKDTIPEPMEQATYKEILITGRINHLHSWRTEVKVPVTNRTDNYPELIMKEKVSVYRISTF
ncbi:MAG: hypothetical protein LIP08_15350 [Bacteroides sp.]|nr:hypothetical protein [Bacteroides sp.]